LTARFGFSKIGVAQRGLSKRTRKGLSYCLQERRSQTGIMAATQATKRWSSLAGRSRRTGLPCCLGALLLIGHPPDLLSLVPQNVSSSSESGREEAPGEAEVMVGSVARASQKRGGLRPTPSQVASVLLGAGSIPPCLLPVSVPLVSAFAKRNGVGTPMRC
jgi:hypothetical protein